MSVHVGTSIGANVEKLFIHQHIIMVLAEALYQLTIADIVHRILATPY